ncbi:MAG: TolC family protein [Alphaproteobacteria bacterium]|nr:TolC family protein [Alphaproteobacteria bacterium]
MIPALILLAAAPAQAAPMSYEDALQRALDRNPELLGASESRQSAEGALMAAKATFDPTLTASTGWTSSVGESTREFGEVLSDFRNYNWEAGVSQYFQTGTSVSLSTGGSRSTFRYELRDTGFIVESEDPEFSTDLGLSITQNLLQGLKPSYNQQGVRSAQRALDSAALAAEQTRQRVLADTARAYWALYQAQQLVMISDQALEVAQEEERIVLAKVEAGDLAPVERSRVAAAVVQARSGQLEARNNRDAAAEALQLLVGVPPDGAIEATTAPAEPTSVSLDLDALVAEALANNPELQSARNSEQTAELDLADARHGRLPELSATASYTLKGYETALGQSYGEVFSGDLRDIYVGGNLSVPLGNRADRGSVIQSQAALAQARITREAMERTISQTVRSQARQVEQAGLKLELAIANQRLAEETLGAERALQDAGRALQKDVLAAIRAVDDAKVAVAQAHADHALAVVELMRVRGKL